MSNFASNDNMTALFTAAGEKIGERAKIFPGTKAEWDALPLSEKIKYDYVAFAGDSQSGIVDDVPTEDSENLVKSGGVFDAIKPVSDDVDGISDEIADMNNVLGAKNLLNPIDYHGFTMFGVTSTINSDGTISLSGTATATNNLPITKNWGIDASNLFDDMVGQEAILSDGTDANTYIGVLLKDANGAEFIHPTTNNGEVKFTISQKPTTYSIYCNVVEGVDYTGVVIKPMIRSASITDDTYVPYSMTNREMTPYVQAISNPNLLDNPWFTVNQRGITSWSNESAGYSADRWKHDGSATGNITNGVYTCNAPTYQICEDDRITPLLGKTVTLSWILSDGSIGFETKTLPSALTSEYVWPFTNIYVALALKSGNASQVARITAGVAVKAVKLELGSVSTLAMDTAPNYATELLKCQRYFYRLSASYSHSADAYCAYALGESISATKAIIVLHIPVKMRTIPTISQSGAIAYVESANSSYKAVTITLSSIAENVLMLYATGTGLTAGNVGLLSNNNDATAYIDLSADL